MQSSDIPENYPHNDDLLRSPADQALARELYGPVAFALIFPGLLEHHVRADAVANAEKRRIRSRGLTAVSLVTAAILMASIAPYLHEGPLHYFAPQAIGLMSALLGIAGSATALRNSPTKWLEHRLVTESLRQFHFSLLVRLTPEILAAAKSEDHGAFERKRDMELADFCQNLIARKSSVLASLTREREVSKELRINPPPDAAIFKDPNGALLLKAYRNLRIVRQCQYADYKLSHDSSLVSHFPRRQLDVLGTLGVSCVVLLLSAHVLSALLVGNDADRWVHLAAVWIAIAALTLRVIEEGLKPRAEVERYRHYQSTTYRILERFDKGDVRAQLQAAEQLEQASFDEMTIFLRAQQEAKFIM